MKRKIISFRKRITSTKIISLTKMAKRKRREKLQHPKLWLLRAVERAAKKSPYITILRPEQWYKNLLVFIAVFFTGNLFNFWLSAKALLGFIALSAISSAGYILNDIADKEADKKHPEKKSRAIASGEISVKAALTEAAAIAFFAIAISLLLSTGFFFSVAALFLLTIAYSLWLKKAAFADIIVIGINFVLRAVSGALLIHVFVSPWLIIGSFFTAVFLAAGKRKAEQSFKSSQYRHYEQETLQAIINSMLSLMIVSYALYCSFKADRKMLVTLPIFTYICFRYYFHISKNSIIARKPHYIAFDKAFMLPAIAMAIIAFVIFYIL